ncbi:glycosyltransferase [Rubidibacter lacunae KORDI 51-2]|uniref:Glycosyltransferase n=1 Tax=Rubidibacter lacunae KORDI 51-2 TaxID=582515 RepID=U5DPH5_9CHRO|nr:glycosyltransferase family 4 protein [Rubidibacter lacunae]ERN42757.1 glycosyltransferase [Rubidibacter lacunae KORDI 51-2]
MSSPERLRVLLIIEQCNPDWASVPLEGYNYYCGIARHADVHLVTHGRNAPALSRTTDTQITYIYEGVLSKRYYKLVDGLTARGRVNWPLRNALAYPIYEEFNRQVCRRFSPNVERGDYDLVHAITPMMPRYPVAIHRACLQTPFLLGPVNGGVPFPPGFGKIARQESAQFNFLRAVGRSLLPDYVATYKNAHKILAGSTYTLELLKRLFAIPDERVELFYENGIDACFLDPRAPSVSEDGRVRLLFVGRLVPYKGADMILDAIANLDPTVRDRLVLTIVGDGSERSRLEEVVRDRGLNASRLTVEFAGWVPQAKTLEYYRRADIFCFPSIREFGGAVVLEAMACGLPCIVVDNGGIGEYVTEQNGYKIAPTSRAEVVTLLEQHISTLVTNNKLRAQMSEQAIARAREFTWSHKSEQLLSIYRELIVSCRAK